MKSENSENKRCQHCSKLNAQYKSSARIVECVPTSGMKFCDEKCFNQWADEREQEWREEV